MSTEARATVQGPLAQLDRASGYGPEGQGFESLGVRHRSPVFEKAQVIFFVIRKNYARCGDRKAELELQ